MTKPRQHVRYKVEFPATFAGDHAGMGIVYNIGMGGCKMVSHRKVKTGDLISVHLNVPKQHTPIVILAAKVQWVLEHGFGVEFHEIQKQEHARLERFLDAQEHIAS
jgi:PilZ domain-containing protein